MELIERRAGWLAVTIGVVLVFDSSGGIAYSFGGLPTWKVVIYVGGLACLAIAGALVAAALAPAWVRPFTLEQRERFMFFALALVALALISIASLAAHAAFEAHRHPQG